MTDTLPAGRRERLNRTRVLQAAVSLADEIGIDSLSMRRLAQELQVVPMALYKHVANKEELLDGMVDVIVGEIEPPAPEATWKSGVRSRVLSARRALQRHPWARRAIETRTGMTPAVLDYLESFIGAFLAGGFSLDLTHHAMHALGGRMWGFTQELFEDPAAPAAATTDAERAEMLRQAAQRYPNVVAIASAVTHDEGSVVGHGCDDQFEFEFALDLLLDGFERLHARGWSSQGAKTREAAAQGTETQGAAAAP
ncbi:TetR/AcrR family transcriptional regulator C-terminal domain-containing protein [Arthrobacter sp. TMN-37]